MFFSRADPAADAKRQEPVIDLQVSEDLETLFVPVTKTAYSRDELGPLFDQMRTLGDAFCAMKHNKSPTSLEDAQQFITPDLAKRYLQAFKAERRSIEAGCWNFFQMNDKKPDRDFALIKALFPAEAYDCYSVGFAQPYIMHDKLGCSTLTMVDLDWRVLDAHHNFVEAYADGLVTSQGLDEALATVPVSWVAWAGPLGATQPATLNRVCGSSERDMCRAGLQAFQSKWDALDKVQLDLTSLHATHFVQTDTPKVFFLSNAIEPMYTRRHEFDALIENLRGSLRDGQHAYLVHHVGGYANFGVYDYSCRDGDCTLTAVCRDVYISTAIGAKEPTYKTYFESVSIEDNAPRCTAMWKEHVRDAGR